MRFLFSFFSLSSDDTEQIAASSPCSIAEKNGVQQQFASFFLFRFVLFLLFRQLITSVECVTPLLLARY